MYCECCNYTTINKGSFEKHLKTKKHEKNQKNKSDKNETTDAPNTNPNNESKRESAIDVETIMSKANQLKMQVEEIKRSSQDVNDIRDKIFNFSEFIMDVMNKTR